MISKYHREITHAALSKHVSEKALKTILKANLGQDRLTNQIGHDHLHFDSNTFEEGFAYIAHQEYLVIFNSKQENYSDARKAFGRLIHTWQDFYSHSNYVRLWLDKNNNKDPHEIDFDDQEIIKHPDLKSGVNYGIIEYFALLPVLSNLIKPHMPADSHAIMNLDTPSSGPAFSYVYYAALKRTQSALDSILEGMVSLGLPEECFRGQKMHE